MNFQSILNETRDEEMDIIQAPKCIKFEDLPPKIKTNEPFEINGISYVMKMVNPQNLEVCSFEEDSEQKVTTVPTKSRNYFVIKRI